MNYPAVFEFHYSKKYLLFFQLMNITSIGIIWYLYPNLYLAIMLTMFIVIYLKINIKIIKNQYDSIVFNKENIVINGKKVSTFKVQFTNNVWSAIAYKYPKQKTQHLLIFNDSCSQKSIHDINKYLNFFKNKSCI